MAFPPGDVAILDDFNRANGAPSVGRSDLWDTTFVDGTAAGMTIVGNALTSSSTDGGITTKESLTDFIRIFDLPATSGGYVAFGWRLHGKGTSTWSSYGFVAQGTTWNLVRYDSAVSTTLASATVSSSPSTGDKLGIYAHGDTHEVYLFRASSWNQTPLVNFTDTSGSKISTAGGCWFELNNAGWSIDNYSQGDLAAPTTPVTIYVDANSGAASDSITRLQGSNPSTPFKTVDAACWVARAAPTWADTVLVKRSTLGNADPTNTIDANVYPQLDNRSTNRASDAPGWLFRDNSGNQPILVKGEVTVTSRADVAATGGTGALPKIYRAMWRGLTNWQFEGIQFGYNVSSDAARTAGTGHDFSTLGAWERSTDITFRRCYFTGGAGIPSWWAGTFTFTQNVVHSPLPPDGGNPGFHDGAGLRMERLPGDSDGGASVGNLVVTDNEFSNVRGDDACTMGGTLFSDAQWTTQSFTIDDNLFWNVTEGANPNFHTDSIQILSCNNVGIHRNVFIGCSTSLIASDGRNGVVAFENNLVVGGGSQLQIQGCDDLRIRHNTMYPTSPDKTATIMFYTREILPRKTILTMENNVFGGVWFRDSTWAAYFDPTSIVRNNATITQPGQVTPYGTHLAGIPEFGHSARLDVLPNVYADGTVVPRVWELANTPTLSPGIGQGIASSITVDRLGRTFATPPDVGCHQSTAGTAVTPIARPPYVTARVPDVDAIDVAKDSNVSVTLYPKPGNTINASTVNGSTFALIDPAGVSIPTNSLVLGSLVSGHQTITMDINGDLFPYVVYTVLLEQPVADSEGSTLDQDIVWSFRVLGPHPLPAVGVTGVTEPTSPGPITGYYYIENVDPQARFDAFEMTRDDGSMITLRRNTGVPYSLSVAEATRARQYIVLIAA